MWDPDVAVANADKLVCEPAKPVLKLWAPSHMSSCQLSSQGLLSIVSGFDEVYVSATDYYSSTL